MKLPLVRKQGAQNPLAAGGMRSEKARINRLRLPLSIAVVGILCLPFIVDQALSQQRRMVIDGLVRSPGSPLPPTTKIRVLREDGSIARTVRFYDPVNYRFGIRLSSQDEFFENEKIRFRIVVTAQDSFVARFAGAPLVFKGTPEPTAAPTTNVELFRNSPPTIYRSLRDTTIDENQDFKYRLVAVDRNADTVHFGMENAPKGATLDSITGMFAWKPTFDQAGYYRITFLITDAYDTDSTRIAAITVRNVDRPPYFLKELPDTMLREADTLRFSIQAQDPDGDRVLYRIDTGPPGLEIDSSAGILRWIPTYDQSGNYLIRVLADDGVRNTISHTARIAVINVNRPPAFVAPLADTTIEENQALHYTFFATDPDRDSVWYSLKNGPNGLALKPDGQLTWIPSFTQAGEYRIIVSAHDQDSSVDHTARIRILNVDRPPGPFVLFRPSNDDTIRLALSTPIRFAWSRSFDPDTEDILRYRVRLWGPRLDTVVNNLKDTVLSANMKASLQPLSVYHWAVSVSDGTLSTFSADTFSFRTSVGIVGSAELLAQIPRTYYLEQNVPDPFNPMTTIRYALPERSYVKLTIFNMLGEPLLVLVTGEKDAGVYDVTFDASDFTSGAYMFRLDAHPLTGNQSKDFVNTKKMFIVR
ncbi:MAG TPA: putative Ig domain-containing protein [Bacteroidota bacterium]